MSVVIGNQGEEMDSGVHGGKANSDRRSISYTQPTLLDRVKEFFVDTANQDATTLADALTSPYVDHGSDAEYNPHNGDAEGIPLNP